MHVLLAIRFVFTQQARLQSLACIVGYCIFEISSCLVESFDYLFDFWHSLEQRA